MPPCTEDERRRRFGARIRQLRNERGLTLEGLADRAFGRNAKWIGRVERGDINPGFDYICSLADGLDIDVAELFTGWDELGPERARRPAGPPSDREE